MPELPEVETVRRTLLEKVLNKTIQQVHVLYPNIIAAPSLDTFCKNIQDQTIIDIKRRGKWLLFELNEYYLLSHLRMEGKYNIKDKKEPIEKHEHVVFDFTDNTCLRYRDTRKFGRMYLYEKKIAYQNKPLNELGVEPWDEVLTVSYLKEKYQNKKLPIKTVILDQSIITGIGNIYADEILFLCHIHPLKQASKLEDIDLRDIIDNTKKVLEEAITQGGTTIRTYESSEGVHGRFQQNLLVHNRQGEQCYNCHDTIIKMQVNGRGTYYCPTCQKENK